MDNCEIRYRCTFLTPPLKRMLKKMNYASLQIVLQCIPWTMIAINHKS